MKNILVRFKVSTLLKWVLAIVILVFALFPIWWMFTIVFTKPGVPISVNPRLWPTSFSSGIENIVNVISATGNGEFLKAYIVSITYTGLQIVGVLVLCSTAAYEFALFNFPGKKFLFSIILLALMMPAAVTLVPTYLLVSNLHWLNSMQGLVVPGIASAFGLFMLTQFLEDIPKEIMDAAVIDGASHFDVFRYIVLPLSTNALVTLAIITFINTWGNFIWPLVIAQKNNIYTVSQLINRYNGIFQVSTVNTIMTANLLASLPPLIFFLIFQNKIIKGVSMSGIKG